MSQIPRCGPGCSGGPARTAMEVPSGEISRPPIVACALDVEAAPGREVRSRPAAHELDPDVRALPFGREVRHELPVGRDRGVASRLVPGVRASTTGSEVGRRTEPVAGSQAREPEGERQRRAMSPARGGTARCRSSTADVSPVHRSAKARSLADWWRCSGPWPAAGPCGSSRAAPGRIEVTSGGPALRMAGCRPGPVPAEGAMAGERLVHHGAEREEVAAAVEGPAETARETCSPRSRARRRRSVGAGERGVLRSSRRRPPGPWRCRSRAPSVGVVAGEEQVLGLQVPVDDVRLVGGPHPVGGRVPDSSTRSQGAVHEGAARAASRPRGFRHHEGDRPPRRSRRARTRWGG